MWPLWQNCEMMNATPNSTVVVLTENDFPGDAFERRKPAKLRRRNLFSLELVVWVPNQYFYCKAPLNVTEGALYKC